ncbi:MAG TPA: hypothetical protein VGK14_00865 [Novimethylophilus sp.]|uniref:hypothetical protein n=1 Tax=Novimethylophilus sp. TaxID=2137426 RepID=UPI002F401E68
MKQYWDKVSTTVLALSQRERVMVLGGVLALIWVVFDTLLLTPMLQKNKLYRQEIIVKQEEVAKLQQQELSVIKAAEVDPDVGNKTHLTGLQRQMTKMDADLQAMERELIAPENMPRVLDNLLQKDKHLKLVSLKTLPVSGLMDGTADAKGAPMPVFGIYKHGFQVTLEGGYFDLANYVAELEASPWRMLWENLDLNANAYPKSTLTLTLYTLSLDKTWLSL